MIGIIKVHSITLRISVFIGIDAVRLMPVERLSYVVSNFQVSDRYAHFFFYNKSI